MASTKFQVGLSNDQAAGKKPSNFRGRTHTDIFGTHDQAEPTPKKDVPESSKNIEGEAVDGKEETSDGKTQNENKAENGTPAQSDAFERVRMPPGGYSSKLW